MHLTWKYIPKRSVTFLKVECWQNCWMFEWVESSAWHCGHSFILSVVVCWKWPSVPKVNFTLQVCTYSTCSSNFNFLLKSQLVLIFCTHDSAIMSSKSVETQHCLRSEWMEALNTQNNFCLFAVLLWHKGTRRRMESILNVIVYFVFNE